MKMDSMKIGKNQKMMHHCKMNMMNKGVEM